MCTLTPLIGYDIRLMFQYFIRLMKNQLILLDEYNTEVQYIKTNLFA